MRITSGTLRGRELATPKNTLTHPMGSRERLALFNSLSNYLDFNNITVLDAFAGTGALGLEALSRGAKSVTFVEKDPAALAALRTNLKNLAPKSSTTIIKAPVSKFHPAEKYDLILIDPPYDHFDTKEFIHLTANLKKPGLLVLSHPATATLTPIIAQKHLKLLSDKAYAAARLAFFQTL